MKRVLMVAYLFPPVGGLGVAGSQRVLKFAKYLPDVGWQPIVLSIQERYYESYFATDPSLLTKIPSGIAIIRTKVIRWLTRLLEMKGRLQQSGRAAEGPPPLPTPSGESGSAAPASLVVPPQKGLYQSLKDTITDLFEIPDEEMGWILPGVAGGLSALRPHGYDAIFATGRPWTALVIGLILKRVTGKPLAVDFRDPWMTNPFRIQYSPLRNRLERWLERQVVRGADVVIANTEELRLEFVQRFPKEPAGKFMALLNGFDPEDFGSHPESKSPHPAQFTIAHTGFLYGKRDPKNFLEAVRVCLEQSRIDRKKIRVVFVGAAELSYDLPAYLAAAGLSDVVRTSGHVPYQDSLACLRAADVLLLLQPGTTTQVPSKLFDYIGIGKPILGISPLDGATSRLMMNNRLGLVADPDDIVGIVDTLTSLYKAWDSGSLAAMTDGEGFKRFDVRYVTRTLAERLADIVGAQS